MASCEMLLQCVEWINYLMLCCAAVLVCSCAAAASVDTSCVSDAWLSAFLKASQPRLSAFEPVQLAHTANSLAIIARSQRDLNLGLVDAAWQGAFVQAAAQQLEAGRFGRRNLSVLVRSLQVNMVVVMLGCTQVLPRGMLTPHHFLGQGRCKIGRQSWPRRSVGLCGSVTC